MKITVFIGDDFHSQLLASFFLQLAEPLDWQVQILSVRRRSKGSSNELMQAWRKIETSLFPALASALQRNQIGLDPDSTIGEYFRVRGAAYFGFIDDVNQRDRVSKLSSSGQDILVSVRCYQKFSASTIDAFLTNEGASRLLNLHPGRLPAYRGVMTYLHQLAESDVGGTHSLHMISPNWDDGPLLAVNDSRLCLHKTLTTNYFLAADAGANLLFKEALRMDAIGVGQYLTTARSQSDEDAAYHSGNDAIEQLENGRIKLFDMQELLASVVKFFGTECIGEFSDNLRLSHSNSSTQKFQKNKSD